MIYSHVTAEGKVVPIESKNPLPLGKLQDLVGGFIEFVPGPDGTTLCVNEEGRLEGLPQNAHFPWIVGDAVMGIRTDRGEFVGVL